MKKFSERINMEICYVPVAKLKDVQEMMANWRKNNKTIRVSAIAAIFMSFVNLCYLILAETSLNSEIPVIICALSMLLLVLEAVIVTKSIKWVYYLSYLSTMFFSFSASCIGFGAFTLPAAIVMSTPHIVNFYYSHKAIYNYENVYLKLKERKGFPNFVFSTADMYSDKLYLKEEDKTVAEKRVEASFYPFNEDREILDEEVRRVNTLRYEELKHHEKNVAGAYYESKEKTLTEDIEKEYKYKFSILGIDIIIPHNDFKTAPMEEKRFFMGAWNSIKDTMFRSELFMIMVFILPILVMNLVNALVATGIEKYSAVLYFIPVITYVFGTNFIKLNQIIGVPVMICSVLVFLTGTGSHVLSNGFILFLILYFGVTVLPNLIKFTINFPAYKKLSREKGFPSFVETTADLYADQIYIVEKPKPIVKTQKAAPIVMDVGYDEEENKSFKEYRRVNEFDYREQNKNNMSLRDDKGWNAFDYLDKDKDNSAYDDFEFYEQVYEARKNAKASEEKQTPNTEMGRRKTDED